jgi:hypothetical protein
MSASRRRECRKWVGFDLSAPGFGVRLLKEDRASSGVDVLRKWIRRSLHVRAIDAVHAGSVSAASSAGTAPLRTCSAVQVRERQAHSRLKWEQISLGCPQSCHQISRLVRDGDGSQWPLGSLLGNRIGIGRIQRPWIYCAPSRAMEVRWWRRRESNYRVKSDRNEGELPPLLPPRCSAELSARKAFEDRKSRSPVIAALHV